MSQADGHVLIDTKVDSELRGDICLRLTDTY